MIESVWAVDTRNARVAAFETPFAVGIIAFLGEEGMCKGTDSAGGGRQGQFLVVTKGLPVATLRVGIDCPVTFKTTHHVKVAEVADAKGIAGTGSGECHVNQGVGLGLAVFWAAGPEGDIAHDDLVVGPLNGGGQT